MMNRLNELQWPLIVGMGAFACITPFMNITGMMELLGRPFGPILIYLLISVAWVGLVTLIGLRAPVLTLTCTGVVYGGFTFLLGAILAPLFTGQLFGPLANPFILPFAVASIVITHGLWGLALGAVAWGLQQVVRPAKQPGS